MDNEKIRIQNAIDRRLSSVQGDPFLAQRIIAAEKGEKEMKKFSVSLALVLALMLVTLSVGFALVSSGIIDHLYGHEEAPQAIVDSIVTPKETAETQMGKVTVDEILYDGVNLHTTITVENPTAETLLYTIDGLKLNGERIIGTNALTDGAGFGGMVLGGCVQGRELPASYTLYSKGEWLNTYDENGKFAGTKPFGEGEAMLTVDLAVWQPINDVEIVNYRDYEGNNISEVRSNLVTDERGLCELELFRPEAYYRAVTAKDVASDVYADVYEALGWAKKVDALTLTVPVTLSKSTVPHGTPTEKEYKLGDVTVIFNAFDFTQAGGQAKGVIRGDAASVHDFLCGGVQMVDKATDRVFTSGLTWASDGEDRKGVEFTLYFAPFTGDIPQRVQLVPTIEYNDRWVPSSPAYDPSVIKPDNAVDCWVLDFDRAVTIDLTVQ